MPAAHRRCNRPATPARATTTPACRSARLAPRLRLTGDRPPELRGHPYALDVTLAWDGLEVQQLLAAGGEARFAGYLAALPSKLRAWPKPRGIDFRSLS